MNRKLRTSRLAVKFSAPRPGEAGLGFALIRETGRDPRERAYGDPLALALDQTAAGESVDLIAYTDAASFSGSQAARDGLTQGEHMTLIQRVATHLRDHGRIVTIKWVTAE